MDSPQPTLLGPGYLRQFKCVAGECVDTCCRGWQISVDKGAYEKYRQIRNEELKRKLDTSVVPLGTGATDIEYAGMVLEDDERCPMLTPANLCLIHQECGADYLPQTCFVFPRLTIILNGAYEQCGDVACPVMARLALLNPEKITFEQIYLEADQQRLLLVCNVLDTRTAGRTGPMQKRLNDVRLFSLHLLQTRSLRVTDRLILLGMFYRDLQDSLEKGRPDAIPELIGHSRDMMREDALRDHLAAIPRGIEIQVGLLTSMVKKRFTSNLLTNERFLQCYREFLQGIGCTPQSTVRDVASAYQRAFRTYYEPYMQSHEYILENYLVNDFYRHCLPFRSATPHAVFDDYRTFVTRFALMKMHLIGMAGCHEGLTDELTLKLIQSFGKVLNNNSNYMRLAHDFLADSGYTTMAHMAILINN